MNSPVRKIRQAVAKESEVFGDSHGHELNATDLVSILVKMSDPEYIVYEEENDRFNEVIRYENSKSKWVYAIVEVNNNTDGLYMNSYNGGPYNTSVTIYPVHSNEDVKKLIRNKSKKITFLIGIK